ncbi:zf-HC2 domain-containing protein [Lujinxingia vulgaris]|uniref:Zf-HC2 domain-containing protein n=1 Tax=Lujinxingia vulgaris TaxID=2600176 RepID=A0A5C6X7X9_9DELT|nr:zf-HC2 domain-containing protein [Lujinxingia vulgaris]TXD35209.1 zf-HC2 domain-containing protein [Lujinxingia vulgaris]
MSSSELCKKIRIDAFDLRRGELSGSDLATLDAHVEHCASCRDYVERLGDMLDEATIWDPADPVPFDADALFSRIEDTLDAPHPGVTRGDDARLGSPGESWPAAPPTGERPAHRLTPTGRIGPPPSGAFSTATSSDDDTPARRSASAAHLIIALAAALVAFLAWPLIFSGWVDEPHSPSDGVATTADDAPTASDNAATLAGGRPAPAAAEDAESAPTLELDALRLFASDDARWGISVLEQGWEIEARQGTLVLEFLPTENQTLQVRFPGAEATVVGTAFYVDADQSELGVITGEVVVREEGGEEEPVLGGSAWAEGRQRPIPPTRWASVTTHVDPESHRARQALAKEAARARASAQPTSDDLADDQAASAPNIRQASPRQTSPENSTARAPGPATLRLEAEEAMRRRNFAKAAAHYEDLLEVLGSRDRAAATVRLDLALLYYRQLNDEHRAIDHLTYFANTWPDDMAAPIAINELCRLLGDRRAQSPHCGGR